MSLRFFHLLFITVSAILSLGFSVWLMGNSGDDALRPAYVLLGLAATAAIAVYGIRFYRKTRDLETGGTR